MSRLTFILVVAFLVPAVKAQDAPITLPTPEREGVDARLFRVIYDEHNPAFEATMQGVNAASKPLFVAIVPVVGAFDLASDSRAGPTARLMISEGAAIGATFLLKHLVQRPRPFVALRDVTRRQGAELGGVDPYSFPSGHSATAFAIATSASLSYPEWYVIVPSMTWATATAVARVWHGMHYPSDIAVGAVLGAGIAFGVHELLAEGEGGETINPANAVLPITFAIRLN